MIRSNCYLGVVRLKKSTCWKFKEFRVPPSKIRISLRRIDILEYASYPPVVTKLYKAITTRRQIIAPKRSFWTYVVETTDEHSDRIAAILKKGQIHVVVEADGFVRNALEARANMICDIFEVPLH